MDQSRRQFLLGAGAAAAGLTLTAAASGLVQPAAAQTDDNTSSEEAAKNYIFVIDLNTCDGCAKCTEACQAEMAVPPTSGGELEFEGKQPWIQVFKTDSGFIPVPCQNCQNAPCTKVCPVGATFYSDDHIVLIDQNRCIGCRYCIVACPYERRFFNWFDPPSTPDEQNTVYSPDYNIPHRKGVAEKCIWCRHRVAEGTVPACVDACRQAGMSALWFGDAAEGVVTNGQDVVSLSELIKDRGAYTLNPELGTLPQVLYLPPKGENQ